MRLLSVFCFLLSLSAGEALAQQTSGSIQGRVVDSQGAVVTGAKVSLINQRQGTASGLEAVTNSVGAFVFTPLQPSDYTLIVEAPGFSRMQQKDITLYASQRLSLPDLALTVGSVTDSVNVEASRAVLQTLTAERSGTITGSQVTDIAVNGRNNYTGLFKTVAGSPPDSQNNSNGRRSDSLNVTMDGITTMDSGNNGTNLLALNLDSVAEMTIITNGQQAQYGRTGGFAVTLVTKSGGRDFHGSGYIFHRHEDLNANSFTNNYNGVPRARYRYNNPGFTFGGPVLLPKVHYFKDKLFFFVAGDFLQQLVIGAERDLTVPTALERTGDFSQSKLSNGSRPTILDPTNGNTPFPGNVIPQGRFNSDGQKILQFYPLPNIGGQSAYNYYSQFPNADKPRQNIVRADYNITDRWRLYVRAIINPRPITSVYGDQASGNNIGLGKGFSVPQNGSTHMANLTTIITPTLTNELIVGRAWNEIGSTPLDDTYTMAKVGLTFKPLFPDADKLHFIPNFSWGGISNAPSTSFQGQPYYNQDPTHDITDNVSKLWGAHNLKAGFFRTQTTKQQTCYCAVNGNMSFGQDSQNPGDTGYAFSNALLGNYQSFQQANVWPNLFYKHQNVEWYGQDTWKVSRTVTLDFGLRMAWVQSDYEENNGLSSFNPGLFSNSQTVTLYQPALNAGKQRVAVNPLTGIQAPAVLIGAVVPNSGNLFNGIIQAGVNNYPRGLKNDRGIQWGPRFGIAWNPQGRNTVIRAGGGIFYDRVLGNVIFGTSANPPMILTPTVYYGNLTTLGSAGNNFFPSSVTAIAKDGKVPTTYNWNITVQRKLPFGVLADAAYVGNVSSHLPYGRSYNDPAFGSAWLPQNQDLTLGTPKNNGDTTLPLNLYRPYVGLGSISMTEWGASSNYHSLQVEASRHIRNGLEFTLAYTYSKAMDIADAYNSNVPLQMNRNAFYGLAGFDRTQALVVTYIYHLPKFAHSGWLNNPAGHVVLNGWEFSGITTLASGAPSSITYSLSGIGSAQVNREITGSETIAPRPVLVGNPNLPSGDRNMYSWINTSVVQAPVKGSTGADSSMRQFRGPGTNNFDLSLFKNISYGKSEGRFIQLRVESFNAFNHTQGSGINSAATFNAAGAITNLPTALGGSGGRYGFGAVNGFRTARIIQLAAKLYF
jgi:Carboxypeptidase regulatory-like domain